MILTFLVNEEQLTKEQIPSNIEYVEDDIRPLFPLWHKSNVGRGEGAWVNHLHDFFRLGTLYRYSIATGSHWEP